MPLLKVISKKDSDRFLLALLENGEMNFGKLAEMTEYPANASRVLKELIKEGLITRRVMQDEKRSVIYSLTPKGKKVALLLVELKELEGEGNSE